MIGISKYVSDKNGDSAGAEFRNGRHARNGFGRKAGGGLIVAGVIFALVTCANPLSDQLKQQISDQVAKANAPTVNVRIDSQDSTRGITDPTGTQIEKIGFPFSISATVTSNFVFKKWVVTPSSDYISIDNPKNASATARILKAGPGLSITAQYWARPSILFVDPSQGNTAQMNKKITLNFQTDQTDPTNLLWIDSESLSLSSMTIQEKDSNAPPGTPFVDIKSYFDEPVQDPVDKNVFYLNFASGHTGYEPFQTILVDLPSTIKDTAGNSLSNHYSWNFQTNNVADQGPPVVNSVTFSYGSLATTIVNQQRIGGSTWLANPQIQLSMDVSEDVGVVSYAIDESILSAFGSPVVAAVPSNPAPFTKAFTRTGGQIDGVESGGNITGTSPYFKTYTLFPYGNWAPQNLPQSWPGMSSLDGGRRLTVYAFDAVPNRSLDTTPAKDSIQFVLDTTPPSGTLSTTQFYGSGSGSQSGQLTQTVNDGPTGFPNTNVWYQYSLDGGANWFPVISNWSNGQPNITVNYGGANSDVSINWSNVGGINWGDGSHDAIYPIKVRYSDDLGNVTLPGNYLSTSVLIDTKKPTINTYTIADQSPKISSVQSTYATQRMLNAHIKSTDPNGASGSGVLAFMLSESASVPIFDASPSTLALGGTAAADTWYAWTGVDQIVPYQLSSGDGSKTVYLWVEDKAGNISVSTSQSIVLDTAAPSVAAITLSDSTSINASQYARSTTVSFTRSASDPNSPHSGVSAYIVNQSSTAPGPDLPGSSGWSTSWDGTGSVQTATLAGGQGTNSVYLWVEDAAGNVSSASDTIILDSQQPSVTMGTISGTSLVVGYTRSASVTFSQSATDPNVTHAGILAFRINQSGGVPTASTTLGTNPNTDWVSWNGTNIPSQAWTLSGAQGTNNVYVWVEDAAGNIGSASRSIYLDSVAPSVNLSLEDYYTYNGLPDYYQVGGLYGYHNINPNPTSFTPQQYVVGLSSASDGGTGLLAYRLTTTPAAPSPSSSVSSNDPVLGWTSTSDGVLANYYSSFDLASLGAGANASTTYYLWVEDQTGNVGSANASIFWDDTDPVIDTALSVNGGSTFASGSGATADFSASDTNPATYTISGVSGDLVAPVSNTSYTGGAVHIGSGLTFSGADGVKLIYLTVTDKSGRATSSSAAPLSVTIDSVPPDIGAFTIHDGSGGNPNPDSFTKTQAVTLSGVSADDLSGIVSSDVYAYRVSESSSLPAGGVPSGSNPATNWVSWTGSPISPSVSLSGGDGAKTIYLFVEDRALNVASRSASTTLDTLLPSVGTETIKGANSPVDLYTNSTSSLVNVSFTISDAHPYSWSLSAGISGAPSNSAGQSSVTRTGDSLTIGSDGAVTVTIALKDQAGNTSSTNYTVTRDTIGANVSAITLSNAASLTPTSYAKTTAVSFDQSANDGSGSGVLAYQVNQNPIPPSAAAAGSGSWSASWPGTLISGQTATLASGEGSNTVYVWVEDKAGNVSNANDSILLDITPPVPGTISLNDSSTGNPNPGTTSRSASVTVSDTTSADPNGTNGSGVLAYQITYNGASAPTAGAIGANWKAIGTLPATATLPNLNQSNSVQLWVEDGAGNVSAAATASMIYDTAMPSAGTLSVSDGSSGNPNPGTYTRSSTVNVSDSGAADPNGPNGSGIYAYRITVNDPTVPTRDKTDADGGSHGWLASLPSSIGGLSPDANNTIRIWVEDGAGNLSTVATDTIVYDATSPDPGAITLHDSSTGNPNAGTTSRSATVSVADTTASDPNGTNGGGVYAFQITYNGASAPAPGIIGPNWKDISTLPATATLPNVNASNDVQLWVEDGAGNVSSAAIGTMFYDTAKPSIDTYTLTDSNATTNNNFRSSQDSQGNAVTASGSITENGAGLYAYQFTTTNSAPTADRTTAQGGTHGWLANTAASFSLPYTLPTQNANNTAYLWIEDAAGNVSNTGNSQSIYWDNGNPSAPSVYTISDSNANSGYAVGTAVKLNLTVADNTNGSGIAGYWISESNSTPTPGSPSTGTGSDAWNTYSGAISNQTYNLQSGDGPKTLYLWVEDNSGRVVSANTSITLDTVAPGFATSNGFVLSDDNHGSLAPQLATQNSIVHLDINSSNPGTNPTNVIAFAISTGTSAPGRAAPVSLPTITGSGASGRDTWYSLSSGAISQGTAMRVNGTTTNAIKTFNAWVMDAAGNISSMQAYSIAYDNSTNSGATPTLTPANITVSGSGGSYTMNIGTNYSETISGLYRIIAWDGNDSGSHPGGSGEDTYDLSQPALSSDGDNINGVTLSLALTGSTKKIKFVAYDAAGNQSAVATLTSGTGNGTFSSVQGFVADTRSGNPNGNLDPATAGLPGASASSGESGGKANSAYLQAVAWLRDAAVPSPDDEVAIPSDIPSAVGTPQPSRTEPTSAGLPHNVFYSQAPASVLPEEPDSVPGGTVDSEVPASRISTAVDSPVTRSTVAGSAVASVNKGSKQVSIRTARTSTENVLPAKASRRVKAHSLTFDAPVVMVSAVFSYAVDSFVYPWASADTPAKNDGARSDAAHLPIKSQDLIESRRDQVVTRRGIEDSDADWNETPEDVL